MSPHGADNSHLFSYAYIDAAAGDTSTYVVNRSKTRTIESSAILEAQRRLADSSSSLDQSDSDSVVRLKDF